jgi:hypothetical protein
MYPDPHVLSRYQERITVMTVLAAEFMIYPDPLAHSNPAGEGHVTVAPFWVLMECVVRLRE